MSGSASRSVRLSSKNSRDPEELPQYKKQLAEDYGPEVAATVDPGSSGGISPLRAGDPGEKENVTLKDWWERDFNVYADDTGAHLLTTKHVLNMYKADREDSEGRNVYLFWQWSQSESNDGWWHAPGKTTMLRNWLDLSDDALSIPPQGYDPQQAHDLNGGYVRIGVDVGVAGVEAGLAQDVYVKQGELGPETNKLDFGGSGSFSVTFDGCRKGRTNAAGSCVVKTHRDLGDNIPDEMLEWNLKTYGDSCDDCNCS